MSAALPSIHRRAISRIAAAAARCDDESRVKRRRSFESCSSAFYFEVLNILADVEREESVLSAKEGKS